MLFEDDWVMRRVRELAAFVARILRLAAGGRAAEALEELERDRARLLPVDPSLCDTVDPASAIALLGDAATARVYARLLVLEADVREALGEVARAHVLLARAVAVYELAARLGERSDPEADALLATIRQRLAGG